MKVNPNFVPSEQTAHDSQSSLAAEKREIRFLIDRIMFWAIKNDRLDWVLDAVNKHTNK